MKRKKLTAILLAGLMGVALTACGNAASSSNSGSASTGTESSAQESTSAESSTAGSSTQENSSKNTSSGKVLVVYMTEHDNTGVDAASSASVTQLNGKDMGKTEAAAHVISNLTGGDIHAVEVTDPYASDYDTLTDEARDEQSKGTEPKLKNAKIENLDQYDTVYIGYPTWWMDMPQAMYTFFKQNDLSGKTVYLYNTSYSSGFSGSVDEIKNLEKNAKISDDTLEISDSDVDDGNLESMVTDWVNGHN